MGFRGVFGPEGAIGSEYQGAAVNISAPSTAVDTTTWALPAGATRWRIYSIWASISGWMIGAATQPSSIRIFAGARVSAFSTFADHYLDLGALAGEYANGGYAGTLFDVPRGVVLDDGEDLELFIEAFTLDAAPSSMRAVAGINVFARAE